MKKRIPVIIASLTLSVVFGLSLLAQETTELTIQVKKDGKVLKDTTYQFEDEAEAKHAMKMMEHMNGGKHANTMVFISEDGEKTEIKEIHGDSLVWIEEGEHEVVKKKEITVIISDDQEGSWTVDSKELKEIDEEENVKVIVIKEKK